MIKHFGWFSQQYFSGQTLKYCMFKQIHEIMWHFKVCESTLKINSLYFEAGFIRQCKLRGKFKKVQRKRWKLIFCFMSNSVGISEYTIIEPSMKHRSISQNLIWICIYKQLDWMTFNIFLLMKNILKLLVYPKGCCLITYISIDVSPS